MISSISFEEYRRLLPDEQEILIWKYATQLMQRNEKAHTYILYQLNAFYIEVVYSVSLNIILTYIAFEDMDRLDNYLGQVDIDALRHRL